MSVSCLRVHDLVSGQADPGDAHVVLVDRLWPRGVRKESFRHDEWCRDAAPSDDLRREFHGGDLDFNAFADRYRDTEQNHALVLAEVVTGEATGT